MKPSRGKLLPTLFACLCLGGCASIGPPVPPSLELPKPPSDLRASRKGDKVTLTWTIPSRTTDRQRVRYLGKTRICRSLDPILKECKTQVGSADPPADFGDYKKETSKKITASFIDTLPFAIEEERPTSFATYAVEVLNTSGRGAGLSNQMHVPLVPTLPRLDDFSAQLTAQGVMISWRCPGKLERVNAAATYLFRINRGAGQGTGETRLAEIDVTDCVRNRPSDAESKNENTFLDQNFEWEKAYFYRGTVVSVIKTPGRPAIEVEGDDTPEVKVFAHDVFPPATPTALQAVFSGPGQQPFVDLIWEPVSDADLQGYNIYRHQASAGPVKVNSELVKTPAYRDTQVFSGNTYFYSVSAVDLRGNESGRSDETNESVP